MQICSGVIVAGNASRENILEDALKLELDVNVINDFLAEEDKAEDDDDDEDCFQLLMQSGGKCLL